MLSQQIARVDRIQDRQVPVLLPIPVLLPASILAGSSVALDKKTSFSLRSKAPSDSEVSSNTPWCSEQLAVGVQSN